MTVLLLTQSQRCRLSSSSVLCSFLAVLWDVAHTGPSARQGSATGDAVVFLGVTVFDAICSERPAHSLASLALTASGRLYFRGGPRKGEHLIGVHRYAQP